jgi:nitrogen fixation protein FixH
MQEPESPGKQPSPQPYSARLEALAAAVTAKESEAAELRKRMHEMSQEFNAHLSASGTWPVQFSAEAGVVHQVRVIRELISSAGSKC